MPFPATLSPVSFSTRLPFPGVRRPLSFFIPIRFSHCDFFRNNWSRRFPKVSGPPAFGFDDSYYVWFSVRFSHAFVLRPPVFSSPFRVFPVHFFPSPFNLLASIWCSETFLPTTDRVVGSVMSIRVWIPYSLKNNFPTTYRIPYDIHNWVWKGAVNGRAYYFVHFPARNVDFTFVWYRDANMFTVSV